jgi:3-dehydroquinate synthase
MKPHTLKIAIPGAASSYDILSGNGILSGAGAWARKCLGRDTQRLAIFSNPTVNDLYGDMLTKSLRSAGFSVTTFLMRDGERYKTLRTVEAALAKFADEGIKRGDAVIALGGGVVGDTAGFAAACHLRGVRFLQVPTTLLAMLDSSVGGKTGVNGPGGKNTIGAFHQPAGVLIDTATLATLPERELNAGFYEAVKHAMLAGGEVLANTRHALDSREPKRLLTMIRSGVEFKAAIVAGDEREDSKKRDSHSRKVLNLGHTFAHALEKVTNYRKFLHGEAVGYGLLYAAEISKSLDLIDKNDINLLYDVARGVGSLPPLASIDPQEVIEAFRFDKKTHAGSLEMVLLKGIGKPVIVAADKIPQNTHAAAFRRLLEMQ